MKKLEKIEIEKNFIPNGRKCITCGKELTGMSQKYCNGKCVRNYK